MHDDETPTVTLRRLTNGYQVTQAIHVAATLGIADLLRDGPRDSAATGAGDRRPTRPRCTACCARWRASGCSTRATTAASRSPRVGECLRSDAAEPVGAWAAFVGRPYHWQAWGALLHGVRTGESPFHVGARHRRLGLPRVRTPRRARSSTRR